MAKKVATRKKAEPKPDPERVGSWECLCGTLGNVGIRYDECTAAEAEAKYRSDVKGLSGKVVIDVVPID